MLLPFISLLKQESDTCRGDHTIPDEFFDHLKNLTGHLFDFFVRLRQFRVNRKPKRVNLKNRPTQCGDTRDEQESARIPYLVPGTS